ncbi:hypothetical protein [Leuconostoc citreum]|uniref:hypothetical protein n=1 Tax=Leuconostoc citreum TaxID=33964 RepID=UPI00209F9A04|nr:hypothetical protein [Leuconostoc citreum]MCP1276571.1 hypothetical protein [Leuconostoc citreum]
MIKITNIETHAINRIANPPKNHLDDIIIPDFHADSKQAMAEYIIAVYDLGSLDGVKQTSSPHVLAFSYLTNNQISHLTAKIQQEK